MGAIFKHGEYVNVGEGHVTYLKLLPINLYKYIQITALRDGVAKIS